MAAELSLQMATSDRISRWLSISWPGILLLVCVFIPSLLLLRVSVAPMDIATLWGDGVTLESFAQFGDYGVMRALGWSLFYSLGVSVLGIAVAFPLTWLITGMRRKWQTLWLIFLLSTLSLSDVLISFSWQVMLSHKQWVSQLLIHLGLMAKTASLIPSVGTVFCSLLYISVPFSVLLLFPALSRLDRSLIEAAHTMGATPLRSFFGLVIPLSQKNLFVSLAMSFISTMGAYTAPLVLGRPEDWPLAVIIGQVALSAQNFPLASSMSLLLLAVTLLVAVLLFWLSRRGKV